ncbi:MAG: hypothetical protein M5R36_07870 [Deltaproteobacteria bacterium]|nr:hypothetical protein [Deltaproteobacteria bacterium]
MRNAFLIIILALAASVAAAAVLPSADLQTSPALKQATGAIPGTEANDQSAGPENFFSWPADPQAILAVPYPNNSYFYAFDEIVLFGFIDNTDYTILNSSGVPIHTGTVDEGQYVQFTGVAAATYQLVASDLIAVLVGAATDNIVGFYDMTQYSMAVGNRFFSYQYGDGNASPHVITAYLDNTSVQVYNLNNGNLLDSTYLDAGESWYPSPSAANNKWLRINANKVVSSLSFSDIGYSVPAITGLFSGTLFYGYMGLTSGPGDLIVTSYADDNDVTVSNASTGATLFSGTLETGQFWSQTYNQMNFKVVSEDTVTVSVNPFNGTTSSYHYMDIVADEGGTRIGTNFYFTSVDGRIDLFSYEDANDVVVTDTKATVAPGDDVVVWSGTLGEGGHQQVASNKTQWHVTATQPLSVFVSYGTVAGRSSSRSTASFSNATTTRTALKGRSAAATIATTGTRRSIRARKKSSATASTRIATARIVAIAPTTRNATTAFSATAPSGAIFPTRSANRPTSPRAVTTACGATARSAATSSTRNASISSCRTADRTRSSATARNSATRTTTAAPAPAIPANRTRFFATATSSATRSPTPANRKARRASTTCNSATARKCATRTRSPASTPATLAPRARNATSISISAVTRKIRSPSRTTTTPKRAPIPVRVTRTPARAKSPADVAVAVDRLLS